MNRHLPTHDQVKSAMDTVLQATPDQRRPTITAVERQLGIPHPTFYRNYPDLITWFKQQTTTQQPAHADDPGANTAAAEQLAALRRTNDDLRRQVRIYAEAIRQLTLDNTRLQTTLNAQAQVADLNARRQKRTTDRNGDPS